MIDIVRDSLAKIRKEHHARNVVVDVVCVLYSPKGTVYGCFRLKPEHRSVRSIFNLGFPDLFATANKTEVLRMVYKK
jgi:hypothetical protein